MNEEKNINDQLLENYYEVMVPNYAPANFVVKKAIGSSVWDVNDKKYIDLPSPIKTLGEHDINVRFSSDISGSFKLIIEKED